MVFQNTYAKLSTLLKIQMTTCVVFVGVPLNFWKTIFDHEMIYDHELFMIMMKIIMKIILQIVWNLQKNTAMNFIFRWVKSSTMHLWVVQQKFIPSLIKSPRWSVPFYCLGWIKFAIRHHTCQPGRLFIIMKAL